MQIAYFRLLSVDTQMACPFYYVFLPPGLRKNSLKEKMQNENLHEHRLVDQGASRSPNLLLEKYRVLRILLSPHFCLFLFLLPDHYHQAAVTESAGLTHRTEMPLFKQRSESCTGNIRMLLELLQGMIGCVVAFDQFLPVLPLKCFVHCDQMNQSTVCPTERNVQLLADFKTEQFLKK